MSTPALTLLNGADQVATLRQRAARAERLAAELVAGVGLEVLAHELARAHRVGDVHRVLLQVPWSVLEG